MFLGRWDTGERQIQNAMTVCAERAEVSQLQKGLMEEEIPQHLENQ